MGNKARYLTREARRYFGKEVRVVQSNKQFQLLLASTAFNIGSKRNVLAARSHIRAAGEIKTRCTYAMASEISICFIRSKMCETSFFEALLGDVSDAELRERQAKAKRIQADTDERMKKLEAKQKDDYRAALRYLAAGTA